MDDAIFRDFDAEMTEVSGVPVQFKLGGTLFHCVSPLPIGSTVVFARHAISAKTATPEEQMAHGARVANVLWSFVIPEEHDALDVAFSKVTDSGMIEKLLEYIITASTGRPTPGS